MRYQFTLIRLIFIVVIVAVGMLCPVGNSRAATDPASDRIAFLAYPENEYDPPVRLMTINPNGFDLRQVVEAKGIFSVVWSPDHRFLCYGKFTDDYDIRDYFITDDAGTLTQVMKSTSLFSWSPDSQHLAYLTGDAKQARLYVAQGDGSDPELLSDKAISGFAWTADSQALYVGINGSLYFVTLKDREFEKLAGYATAPVNFALSPNGKRLSYFVGNKLYLLDTSTHKSKWVGTMPINATYGWSPNSEYVFFIARLRGGSMYAYYLMNGDGSELHGGEDFDGYEPHFTWTPDSKYVWYDPSPSFPSNSLDIATGKLQTGDVVAQIAWSRDGKEGVFASTYPADMLKIADVTFTNIRPIPGTENLGRLKSVAWW